MPQTTVLIYQEADGSCPLVDWLDSLNSRARSKCLVRIERLAELGHELRRPEADYLRDDIYELRVGLQGVNHRMLYFFLGRAVAVLSHGLVKEQAVPAREIDHAIRRINAFRKNPAVHTYRG